MSIDVTSISISARSDGIDQATKSLNNLADASDKAEQAVSKVSTSTKGSSDGAVAAASAIDKLLIKYKAQVDLLGANVAASNAYNAALKGGSDAQQSAAAFLGAEVDAYKALSVAQSDGVAMNKALDASYNSLAKQAEAYYNSQAKIAAAAQTLNDAGFRAQEYKKLQDAIASLKAETDALAATEAREKAIQQSRDIETYTAKVRAFTAAQTEAIKVNNDLAAAEQRKARADQDAFNAIGPTRAALDQANQTAEKFLASLKEQAGVVGLSGKALRDYNAELLRIKASQLGVTDQASGFIQKLQDTEKASGHAASGVSGIFRELLVLGHEASQGQYTRLGGSMIVLAERGDLAGKSVAFVTERAASLGTSIGAVLAPIAAIIAAFVLAGTVIYNFYKASQNYHELTNALLLTNNYAGASADSLLALARASTVAGGSISSAKTAVLELAASGKFTAEQIGYITNAAISLEHTAGVSTKDTIKHFEDLATQATTSSNRSTDAIAKDALKLNDQYHYLTAGIYEQIVAFEKQGDVQTAISISLQAYANNVEATAKKIEANLSPLMKFFKEMHDVASAMWDAISQKSTDSTQKAALQLQLKSFDAPDGGSKYTSKEVAMKYRQTIADQIAEIDKRLNNQLLQDQKDSDKQREEQAKIHGQARMNTLMDQYDKTNKATKDLAQFDAAWALQSEEYRTANLINHTTARENIEEKTHEKEKKIRAEGTSLIDAEIKGIEALKQTQLDADDAQIKSLQNLYKLKKADGISTELDIAAALRDKIKVQDEAFQKEMTEYAIFASARNRTPSEINIIQGKIAEAYKQHEKAVESLNEKLAENGTLVEDVLKKAYDDEDKATQKTVDSIKNKTDSIKAQNEAYRNLPEAIRSAGITDKQMQDYITQAKIDAMTSEIKALEDNAQKDNVYTQQKISNTKKIIGALIDERNQQTEREGQQQSNVFNLGIGARAKEEASMAIAAFNDAGKEISSGFQAIFGDASKPMQDFFKAFTDGLARQTAAQERYNKVKEAYKDAPEAVKILKLKEADVKLTAEQTQANLGMYADVAAGAQGFFDKQSTGYKVMGGISAAFHAAEVAMAIASIAPKIAAGAASMFATLGPFGFAAVAGMIAVMAGLGFAGGGSASAPPTSAVRQAANGTGSVLGDNNAKSDSIQKALDTIAKDSGLGLVHFQSMDKSLQTLVTGIGGLSSLLVRGTNLTAKLPLDTTGQAQELFSSKVLPFSIGEKLTGGALAKLVGNIFGGATSVQDVGLKIGSGTVGNIAANGTNVSQYTDTMTKGGWFSSDKYKTDIKALGSEVDTQFGMVIQSLADTVSAAAKSLGIGGDDFTKHLESFVVDIGQISTKGLTGTQIQEALQAAFSKLGDDMAKFAIQGLDKFQKVGEGYLETVARVANDLMQVQDVYAVLGKTMNATGLAAVDLSEGLISAFGSLTKLADGTKYFVDNFLTDAERIAPIQKSLSAELTRLGVATNITVDQYKALVISQDLSTSAGQQMYAALINIAPAFKAVEDAATAATKAAADEAKAKQDAINATFQGLKDTANSDFAVLSKAITAQKTATTNAYNAQVAILNAQMAALKTADTTLTSLSTSLQNTLDSMLQNTSLAMSRASAQSMLDSALSTAKTTGVLPTAESLKDTLSTLTKDSSSSFSSSFEYNKDLGITAGKIAALNDITKDQKSTVEKQLDVAQKQLDASKTAYDAEIARLDMTLSYAQQQLDAMNGVQVAVKGLSSALLAFGQSSTAATYYGSSNGQIAKPQDTTKQQIVDLYHSVLGREPDTAGLQSWLVAVSKGQSIAGITAGFYNSAEYLSAHPNGSHAGGLDSVPFDGYTAKLHKGEMVLPATQAKGVAQGSDMNAVVEAINNLCADNSAENRSMVSDIRWLKKLFQNVSPNGQTLQVTQTVIS